MRVGIAAYGGEPTPKMVECAVRLVDELARRLRRGFTLILGGDWGLMGVVCRRALERGVQVVCILPGGKSGGGLDGVVYLETGMPPNVRSAILVRSCDVLVVAGGGAGCMMEALMAYRERIPVVALVGCGADSDRFFEGLEGAFDSRRLVEVLVCRSPEEAAEKVAEVSNAVIQEVY